MDLNALMSAMLSEESIAGLGEKAESSPEEVRSVLSSALPLLLNGASAQANNQATASGFLGALQQHSQDDASNVSSFLGNVDMGDGAKIIAHLLGANTATQTQAVAQQTGVSQAQTSNILSAAAPLLLTLPRAFGAEGMFWAGPAADLLSVCVTAPMLLHYLKKLRNTQDGSELLL